MSASLSDITTPLTQDQIRATLVASLEAVGVPASQWRSGSVASTILTYTALFLSLLSVTISGTIASIFLPLSTGGVLQLIAYYLYGITPPAATFATTTVTLVNSGGGTYTIGVGGLLVKNATTGALYSNTASFVLNGTSILTGVPIQATVAGSGGNSNVGAINTLVTILLGVTCSNPTTAVGVDALSDIALRQLCLDSLAARSVRGPRSAYSYAIQVATNTSTGAPVNINRWIISSDSHTGVVNVYVAAPSGVPDTNDVTGVITSIEALARPICVTSNVLPVTTLNYTATPTVWVSGASTTDATALQAAIDAGLITFFQTYPIGGVLASDDTNTNYQGVFADAVKGAIVDAVDNIGGGIKVRSIQGLSDLTLTATQVAANAITTPTIRILTSGTSS